MAPTHPNRRLTAVGGVSPVVDFWTNGTPMRTLVIHTHGMQDPPNRRGGLDLATPHPEKNYAFTVPFNRAMNNIGFIGQPDSLVRYVGAFISNARLFRSSYAPALCVYPYLTPITGLPAALDHLHQQTAQSCDVMCLVDLEPYPARRGYISLDQLLDSMHPTRGSILIQSYDNFLLLACRSSTAQYQVGMGGAAEAHPDGLYPGSDTGALLRYPFTEGV